jgi:Mg-chelatase subunit ChlD
MTTSPRTGNDDLDRPIGPDDRTTPVDDGDRRLHLYVLLDRSGSMASMVDDVIGGVNRLLTEQRADGEDAVVTLVQFDSGNPQDVVADAVPICEIRPLDHETFVPRGSTPLLDATGLLLQRATDRARRHARACPAEEVLVVSVTDGHENASREFTLDSVRRLVADRTRAGWTFVFLGAALDVYGETGGLGYDPRSVQSFVADGAGADLAFGSLSRSTSRMRQKVRSAERWDKGDFFEGDKDAEVDRKRRSG